MTKREMTQSEFIELVSQNPRTRAMIIERIASEIKKAFAQTKARNEEAMIRDNISQEGIDFMRDTSDALLQPTIKQAVLTVLGVNLVDEPQRKQ